MKQIRMLPIWTVCATFLLLAAACSTGGGDSQNPLEKPVVIKAAVPNEQFFYQEFANVFTLKYPNVEFEVISLNELYNTGNDFETELIKLLETENPDLIRFTNPDIFETFANEGRLLNLEPFIQADPFDIDNMDERLIEWLKTKGNGQLYGLSPTYSTSALYYNKELFDRFQIEYPRNQMTWEEVLQLAARFPTDGDEESRIYGLFRSGIHQTPIYDLLTLAGRTELLSLIDAEGKSFTFDTPEWKQVFTTVLDGYRQGYIHRPTATAQEAATDYYRSNLFTVGRAAMMVSGAYYLQELQIAGDMLGITPPDWDVVTVPVSAKAPNETVHFSASELYAIHAQAEQAEAAWEVLKYMNSDEAASAASRSFNGQFRARPKYNEGISDRNLEPFFMLKPTSYIVPSLPSALYFPVSTLIEKEAEAVLNGAKTIDEAINDIQQQGQSALEQYLATQSATDAAK